MTRSPLDEFVAEGMAELDALAGETFVFRQASYTGQISQLGTQQDWVAGGSKKLRRCTILFTKAADFNPEPRIGEAVTARGVAMKIESSDRDATTYQFECVETTK